MKTLYINGFVLTEIHIKHIFLIVNNKYALQLPVWEAEGSISAPFHVPEKKNEKNIPSEHQKGCLGVRGNRIGLRNLGISGIRPA